MPALNILFQLTAAIIYSRSAAAVKKPTSPREIIASSWE